MIRRYQNLESNRDKPGTPGSAVAFSVSRWNEGEWDSTCSIDSRAFSQGGRDLFILLSFPAVIAAPDDTHITKTFWAEQVAGRLHQKMTRWFGTWFDDIRLG
jgi:hypothetical protein